MECPRCGEDNLPGLASCLGCGRPLAAPAQEAEGSVGAGSVGPVVPRVAPRNPLARAPRPAVSPRREWIADLQLALFLRVLGAAAWGLLPGLGPWRRGERRRALALVGALAACAALWLLMWRSELQPLAWMAGLSVLASSCLIEARTRAPPAGPAGQMLALFLSLALVAQLHAVILVAGEQLFPRVALADQQALSGGHFRLRSTPVEALRVDDLVAIGQIPPWWAMADQGLQVASVLATAGQVVHVDQGQLRVDGLPPRAHAVNPAANAPALPAQRLVVPAGTVAVYTDPVQLIGQDRLAGRITTRWLPAADRGPVDWPPQEPTP